jgi:hypothetical protein
MILLNGGYAYGQSESVQTPEITKDKKQVAK